MNIKRTSDNKTHTTRLLKYVSLLLLCAGIIVGSAWWLRLAGSSDVTADRPPPVMETVPDMPLETTNRKSPDIEKRVTSVTSSDLQSSGKTNNEYDFTVTDTGRADSPTVPIAEAEPMQIISFLEDVKNPLPKRKWVIEAIAKRNDKDALDKLKAIANASIYLNWKAVKALGELKDPILRSEAASFLVTKFGERNVRVACAAMEVYSRLKGAEAVEPIQNAIISSRDRPDGYHFRIAETGVELLGNIASPETIPFLLKESLNLGDNLEYGSVIVKALQNISTDEARDAILVYANDLRSQIPDDPLAKGYFEEKISEAEACARK